MRALALAMTLAAAGCATQTPVAPAPPPPPPQAPPPAPAPPTIDGDWFLVLARDAPQTAKLTGAIRIADRKAANGSFACRTWTGEAASFGTDLRFNNVSPTPVTCEASVQSLDDRLFEALTATRRAAIRNGYLVLIDDVGRDRLYFQRYQ